MVARTPQRLGRRRGRGRSARPHSTFAQSVRLEGITKMRSAAFPQRGPTDKSKKETEFEELKRRIHGKLVDKLDLSRVSELEGDTLKREIRLVVEHLCDSEDTMLNRQERERLIEEVLDE